MISEKNIKIGHRSEQKTCELLFKEGWWVHNFSQNKMGQQPCDIVAMRQNRNMLIDAKHCSKPYLATQRIEANQKTCFEMASEKGIRCGFACEFDGELYFLEWGEIDWKKSYQRLKRRLIDALRDFE